ncbi:MAG: hypothetical protein KF801_03430 [Cryobacterium sp.]|nr:hypothetical protein [Cryobacterium sp.]
MLRGAQRRLAVIVSVIVVAVGVFLVIVNDGHGIAFLLGIAVGGIAAGITRASGRWAGTDNIR